MEGCIGMKKFLKDFKSFAMRGNVLDLAVGVIIGGAFSKIVSSLVNDIIMPIISLLIGRIDLSTAGWPLVTNQEGKDDVILKYGAFLQNILDFLIIALCIFTVIKLIEKFKRKEEVKAAEPPKPTAEVLLLTEIRDLLKAGAPNSEQEKEEGK